MKTSVGGRVGLDLREVSLQAAGDVGSKCEMLHVRGIINTVFRVRGDVVKRPPRGEGDRQIFMAQGYYPVPNGDLVI